MIVRPADRTRLRLVAERIFTANFAGADIPTPAGPGGDEVDLRAALYSGATYVELVPVLSSANCVWNITGKSNAPGVIVRDTVFMQGAVGAIPPDACPIQPFAEAVSVLRLDANPPGGALGAQPFAVLVRMYVEDPALT